MLPNKKDAIQDIRSCKLYVESNELCFTAAVTTKIDQSEKLQKNNYILRRYQNNTFDPTGNAGTKITDNTIETTRSPNTTNTKIEPGVAPSARDYHLSNNKSKLSTITK